MQVNVEGLIRRVERLENENAYLRESRRNPRRVRLTLALALAAGIVCLLMLPDRHEAIAQGNGVEGRVTALEKTVKTLTANLNAEIARAEAAEAALQTAINGISLTPGPAGPQGAAGPAGPAGPAGASPFVLSEDGTTWVLSGYNLQIVNGLGTTGIKDVGQNGLGNLIVGYNAPPPDRPVVRTGSHNMIMADGFNYKYDHEIIYAEILNDSGY